MLIILVNCICSFREYLIANIKSNEEFYVGVVSIFVAKATLMTNEERRKQSLPSNFRIKQIQAYWKGRIGILTSLKERCSPLEDRKCVMSFKIIDDIDELGGPPIVRYSTLIYVNDREAEVSKLKDKLEE